MDIYLLTIYICALFHQQKSPCTFLLPEISDFIHFQRLKKNISIKFSSTYRQWEHPDTPAQNHMVHIQKENRPEQRPPACFHSSERQNQTNLSSLFQRHCPSYHPIPYEVLQHTLLRLKISASEDYPDLERHWHVCRHDYPHYKQVSP